MIDPRSIWPCNCQPLGATTESSRRQCRACQRRSRGSTEWMAFCLICLLVCLLYDLCCANPLRAREIRGITGQGVYSGGKLSCRTKEEREREELRKGTERQEERSVNLGKKRQWKGSKQGGNQQQHDVPANCIQGTAARQG